ncbi:MAG: DNA primase [Oscillospiraceae bacterium]|nr:DNA primase [Oscillospiraceae bacterium]
MAGKRLSDEFLEQLRANNDIVSVISPYVELRRRGKNLVGLCPFHNEKTPSFTVYPDSQSFYCFGCGAGGEVISFVRRIENLDYYEAVKSLADRSGISMPDDGYDDSLIVKRKRMLEMNKEAAKFFYKTLMSDRGKEALNYYLNRGYTISTIKHFGLGYAPDSWHGLLNHLKSLGYSYEEIYEADLAKKSTKNGKINYYDNFRNRVMVPIINVRGQIIAFGGRVLDDSKPKYVNTSDTLVYKKSLGVFALNFAKNENDGSLLLVEGYMDVIALHQAGFTNAVAALGTAFTPEMAKLLSRYASEILLCFDNDEAGKKATARALETFGSVGIKVKVIRMSGGKDPDEIIKKYGPEKFRSFITGAANDIEYKIIEQRNRFDIDSSDGKLGFLKAVTGILAETDDIIARDVYASKISSELNVNKDTLMLQINSYVRQRRRNDKKSEIRAVPKITAAVGDKVNPQKTKHLKAAKAEEMLISSLMRNPDFWDKLRGEITPDDFVTDFNRRVFVKLSQRLDAGLSTDFGSMADQDFGIEEINSLKAIEMLSDKLRHSVKECRDCIEVIKAEKLKLTQLPVDPSDMSDEEFMRLFKTTKAAERKKHG